MISLQKDNPRFLVSRTDALHDVILSFPIVSSLRHHYPQATIVMLVKKGNESLVHINQEVDYALIFDPDEEHKGITGYRRLRKMIAREKFDVVIAVYPRIKLALTFHGVGIPFRIGTARRFFSFLYNYRISMSRRKGKYHEIAYNLKLLLPLGIDSFTPDEIYPKIHPDPSRFMQAHPWLDRLGEKEFIVIQPYTGSNSLLQWPLSYMEDLIYHIDKVWQKKVILLGTNQDKSSLDDLQQKLLRGNRNSAVQIFVSDDIQERAILLQKGRLFICNVGGMHHLALLLGTSLITFFPPTLASRPSRFSPYGPAHYTIFMPDLPACRRCKENDCSTFNCLARISPEIVLEETKQLWSKLENPATTAKAELYIQEIRKI